MHGGGGRGLWWGQEGKKEGGRVGNLQCHCCGGLEGGRGREDVDVKVGRQGEGGGGPARRRRTEGIPVNEGLDGGLMWGEVEEGGEV